MRNPHHLSQNITDCFVLTEILCSRKLQIRACMSSCTRIGGRGASNGKKEKRAVLGRGLNWVYIKKTGLKQVKQRHFKDLQTSALAKAIFAHICNSDTMPHMEGTMTAEFCRGVCVCKCASRSCLLRPAWPAAIALPLCHTVSSASMSGHSQRRPHHTTPMSAPGNQTLGAPEGGWVSWKSMESSTNFGHNLMTCYNMTTCQNVRTPAKTIWNCP